VNIASKVVIIDVDIYSIRRYFYDNNLVCIKQNQ